MLEDSANFLRGWILHVGVGSNRATESLIVRKTFSQCQFKNIPAYV
jgi:hypothetical protein